MLEENHLDVIRAVVSNNVRLVATFPPRRFRGEALLFAAANGKARPRADSWSPFIAGQLAIHTIDSAHETMMDALPASKIGRVLASELGRQTNNGYLLGEGRQLDGS